jgi:ATP-dependent Lon protease
MTGEITLRGNVLPVGGVKEKVLAARRSGFFTIVLPEANRKNIEEIPKGLRRELKFVFVKHVAEVFDAALAARLGRPLAAANLNRDLPAVEPALQPS